MKRWTQHDARSEHIVEADQFNRQNRAARGSIAGLDRSQYPSGCVTDAMLTPAARHKVWVFAPWAADASHTHSEGEQTAYRALNTNTLSEQFRALTYQEYQPGWTTAFETTLTPFKGGSLLTDWCGNVAQQIFCTWSADSLGSATPPNRPNDRYIGLRVLYNGLVVCERLGPAKPIDSFRVICESQVPSGPAVVTLQFRATAIGPDDFIVDQGASKHLMQAHLFSNRAVFVGRWR
jgi:hypothetical protein